MIEEIIFAGFGGQGIMLMGKLLATACLKEGWQVTLVPSYGAEVRGGTAHCMVKISDKEVASPFITSPDTCFAMSQPALEKFKARVKKGGWLIINSSLVEKKPQRKDIKIISLPLTDIAIKLGNVKVANVVALGYFIARKKIISQESLIQAIQDFAPQDKKHLLKINQKALEAGINLSEK